MDPTVWILLAAVLVLYLVRKVMSARGRINGAEAREKVQQGATLLDVRTPPEFAGGAIAGAINVPLSQLANRLAEVPKDKPVVVYCRSGARSRAAAGLLRSSGYEAHDLGPRSAWR